MTISSTINRTDYVGTGTIGPFAYPFKVFAATDLSVTTRNATTGVETTLSYPADFTATGVGNAGGGAITLTAALAAGDALTIRRIRPLTQLTSLRQGGPYFPETVEDAFDSLLMIDQQQQDVLNRALKLPETIDVSPTIPAPEAGKALVWNETADGLINQLLAVDASSQLPGKLLSYTDAVKDNNLDTRFPAELDARQTALGVPTAGARVAYTATGNENNLDTRLNLADKLPGDGRTTVAIGPYLDHNKVANARDYGAIGDGASHPLSASFATLAAAQAVYPDATALTDELDWAAITKASKNAGTLGVGYVPGGTYVLNRQVDFSALDHLILGGKVIFDFTSATDVAAFPLGGFVNIVGGALVALPALAADVSEGDETLTFAADPGLTKGDIVVLYNPTNSSYSGWRTYYRAGEHAIVSDGSGGVTVRRFGGAAADYAAAAVNCYKHAAKRFTVSGGTLQILESTAAALSSVAGVNAKWLAYTDLSAFQPTNSGYAGISLTQCVGIFGTGYRVRQDRFDAGTGTFYGLVIGNSSYIDISGHFVGGRHAVTTGGGDEVGAVPCRYGRVSGHFENSYQALGQITAANNHGNTEYWHYEGTFQGGVTLGGNHNSAQGHFIARATQNGLAVELGELSGCDQKVSGHITAFGDPNVIFRAVIDCGANNDALTANTLKGGTLDFSGLTVDAPDASRLIIVRNRGYVGSEPIIIDLRGMSWLRTTAADPVAVFIDAVSGNVINVLRMDGFENTPNARHSVTVGKIRGWRDSGSVVLNPLTTAASVSAAVTFNRQAPKTPVVVTSLGSNTVGGSISIPYGTGPTPTGFTANARTASGTNFGGTNAGTVNWIATLDE